MVNSQDVLWKTWRDAVRFELDAREADTVSPEYAHTVQERAALYAADLEQMIRGEPVARYVLRGKLAATASGDFTVSGPQEGSLFEVLGRRAGHPVRVTIANGTAGPATHTLIAPRIVGPFLQIDAAKPREMAMVESLRYTLGALAGEVEITFQVYAARNGSG